MANSHAGRFQEQVVLITGASSGIGAALAREFARQGAHIVLMARRAERIEALAEELSGGGRSSLAITGDVTRDGDPERAVDLARSKFGRLDVAVANAGFSVGGRLVDLTLDDYRRQLETNVFGVLRTLYAALPELRKTQGRIVVKLRNDLAPKHAARLKQLAQDKFYDNVPFHRVIAGFMAQTGDGQYGNGTGGSKLPDLKAEFSSVPFTRAVVGMARKGNSNDSANSQFFIMFADAPSLNGKYTVVGQVLSGMEVADKLKKGDAQTNGTVVGPDKMTSVRVAADVK